MTDKAPSSVRDQTFDHQQEAVGYYLDQEIRFDTKACYLDRPSNEVVQKMARLVSLTVDASAPTELSSKQKAKLTNHPNVIKLGQRNKTLTERLRRREYKNMKNARGTTLFQKKKKAKTHLNSTKKRLRVKMIAQTRKRHFRTTNTLAFDAQFFAAAIDLTLTRGIEQTKSIVYNIPDRAKVVQLIDDSRDDLSNQEQFRRRIEAIEARTTLCYRREVQRRDRPKTTIKQEDSKGAMNDSNEGAKDFPVICRPT